MNNNIPCFECNKKFTLGEIHTGGRIKNEKGEYFHVGCYNIWCGRENTKLNKPQPKKLTSIEIANAYARWKLSTVKFGTNRK